MDLLAFAQGTGHAMMKMGGFSSRVIDAPEGPLHAYEIEGRGPLPPVGVLHGLGSSATAFGRFMRALRAGARRVAALDAPGHGRSGEPPGGLTVDSMLAGVVHGLDALFDEPFVLFGTSLGGAMAVRYALLRPEKVRGLVLCSPAGAPMDAETRARTLELFEMPDIAAGRAFVRKLYHRPPWYAGMLGKGMRELMRRPSIRGLIEDLDSAPTFEPGELQRLRAPVLLVWGEDDQLLPASGRDYFAKHLPPGTPIERPADFSHCPQIEHPRRLARLVLDFSAGLPPEAPSGLPAPAAADPPHPRAKRVKP